MTQSLTDRLTHLCKEGERERERVRVTERGKDSEKKREMRTEEIERDCV